MCDRCGQSNGLAVVADAVHMAWVSAKALSLMMDFRGGAEVPPEVSGYMADDLVERLEDVEALIAEARQHSTAVPQPQ